MSGTTSFNRILNRCIVVAAAAASTAALAACATSRPAAAGASSGAADIGTTSAVANQQATASAQLLAAGQTGPRSAVPWRRVGAGWILAEYSASQIGPADGGPSHPKVGPTSLYLINPAGGRYLIYRWSARQSAPAPYLTGWSGDARRALLGTFRPNHYLQLTLASGAISRITLPGNVQSANYTQPHGLALLTVRNSPRSASGTAQRFGLDGRSQLVLGSGTDLRTALDSPDGTTVVVGAAHGLRLLSNAGRQIRNLPVRGTDAVQGGCQTVRWWNGSTVLADCFHAGSAAGNLWLVPASGSQPHELTPTRHSLRDLGDIGAWRLRSGLYLQSLGPCGTEFITRQSPNGSIRVVNVPGTTGQHNHIVSSGPNQLLVQAQTGCGGSDSLLWFKPSTSGEQWLLRTPHLIQGVLSVIEYGRVDG